MLAFLSPGFQQPLITSSSFLTSAGWAQERADTCDRSPSLPLLEEDSPASLGLCLGSWMSLVCGEARTQDLNSQPGQPCRHVCPQEKQGLLEVSRVGGVGVGLRLFLIEPLVPHTSTTLFCSVEPLGAKWQEPWGFPPGYGWLGH